VKWFLLLLLSRITAFSGQIRDFTEDFSFSYDHDLCHHRDHHPHPRENSLAHLLTLQFTILQQKQQRN